MTGSILALDLAATTGYAVYLPGDETGGGALLIASAKSCGRDDREDPARTRLMVIARSLYRR